MWKLCLHTVSYAGFWRGQARLELEAVLRKAKELGYDGVELMAKRPHASVLDYRDDDYKRLREIVDKVGIQVAIIAGYPDLTAGIDRPMAPFLEIQVLYLTELAKMARALDCPLVRVFTGFERPGISYDAQWEACVRGMKEAAKRAADYGVTLVVQNHHDIACHSDAMLWFLEEVAEPNCKAAFDAWAPYLHGMRGEEIRTAVRKLAPYIVHTTCADYVAIPRVEYNVPMNSFRFPSEPAYWAVPMGEGVIDYATFFQALQEIGYRGWVAYEMCSPIRGGGSLENLDKAAKVFLRYMREEKWRKKAEVVLV